MILALHGVIVDLSKPLFTIDLRRGKAVVGGKLVDGLDLSWRMFSNRTEAENCREMLEHAVRKAIGVPSVEDWPEAGAVAAPTPEAARYREFLERAAVEDGQNEQARRTANCTAERMRQ